MTQFLFTRVLIIICFITAEKLPPVLIRQFPGDNCVENNLISVPRSVRRPTFVSWMSLSTS